MEDGRASIDNALDSDEMTFFAIAKDKTNAVWATGTNAASAYVDGENPYIVVTETGAYETLLSDGSTVVSAIEVPSVIDLPTGNLTFESFTEGEKTYITEDRGLGYEMAEVYIATQKTMIDAGGVSLVPWSETEAVGSGVSGVGYYTSTVTLTNTGATGWLLDIGSTNGASAAVYVNGVKAAAVDIDNPVVDISALLVEGDNEITAGVSSTLLNVLAANGTMDNEPQAYGMAGAASLIPYVSVLVK